MFVRKLTFRLGFFSLVAAASIVSSSGDALAKCVTPVRVTPVYNHENPGCEIIPPLCGVDHLGFPGVRYLVWKENATYALVTNLLLQSGWILKSDVKEVPCTRQLRRIDRKRALQKSDPK